MILRWSHIAGRIGWFDGKVLERLGALFGGDAMHNLICRCPKTQQPIDLQLYTDCVSLALIWSNPVRFQCPCCGADHETKVETAHFEPLYSNLVKRSLKPLTLQQPEDARSAGDVSRPRPSLRYAESVSGLLAASV